MTAAADRVSSRARVLILARHFPPIGGAGVQRTVGSVAHLSAYGYEPIVVTGPGGAVDRWSPADKTMMRKIPASTRVHRIEDEEPPALTGVRERVDRALQRPAPWVRWWVEQAVREGVRHGADADVDVVLASCVPYETAYVGARVARALGVPWIADLEDPWALDEMRAHPTVLHHRRDLHRMRCALSTASAVVMCASEAAARVRSTMPELADRVTSIPIGFDADDFGGAPPARTDGVYRIVHTGSMHTELGLCHRASRRRRKLLRGTSLDVDILTRSHVFLMSAIDRLVAAEPGLAETIELVLAGTHTAADRAAIGERRYVRLIDHLPHGEVIDLMRSADLLFLPMHELPPGRRAGLVPYKTYEYLATGRPILAAVPDGDVRDMLSGLACASVVRPSDVAAMAAAIDARRAAGTTGPQLGIDAERDAVVAGYDRRMLVARVAAVLDDVLGLGDGVRAQQATTNPAG